MNSPIIKISDDQNTITHESGVVTVFVEQIGVNRLSCFQCNYYPEKCNVKVPCFNLNRKDKKDGIFNLKQL